MYTLEQAKADVAYFANLYPDRVAPAFDNAGNEVPRSADTTCRYYHNGAPSCIVGFILDKHGVDIFNIDNVAVISLLKYGDPDLFPITEDAVVYLSEVQVEQDGGTRWGNLVSI